MFSPVKFSEVYLVTWNLSLLGGFRPVPGSSVYGNLSVLMLNVVDQKK